MDPSRLKLPDINNENSVGMVFLCEHEMDEYIQRTEVLKYLENIEDESEQFIVGLGDNTCYKVMDYQVLLDILEKEAVNRLEQEEDDTL
jgi:hypothetical protein